MHDVKTKPVDTGLAALVMLMRFQGVAAEPDQILHRFGRVPIGLTEMLRCAKDFGLKARVAKTKWARLASSPLPAIGCLGDGGFLVVGKASGDQVLVSDPSVGRPEMLTRAAFEARWDGRIVFMARRANLNDLTNRFGISWFVTASSKVDLFLSALSTSTSTPRPAGSGSAAQSRSSRTLTRPTRRFCKTGGTHAGTVTCSA